MFLGLGDDADDRAIKKAYAARLRKTRPDSDPDGFQQLHMAYKAALEHCKLRVPREVLHVDITGEVSGDIESSPDAAHEDPAHTDDPATKAHLSPQPRETARPRRPLTPLLETVSVPRFDFAEFFSAMAVIARTQFAEDLTRWLRSEPTFWSLTIKARVGRSLLEALGESFPPMPAECFDALLAFFDLDHVLAGLNELAVQRLRRQLHVRWELLPENFIHLAARMRQPPAAASGDSDLRNRLGEASAPFRWTSILLRTLQFNHATLTANFIYRLSFGRVDELPASFDRRRIAFWCKAANRRSVSLPRVIVGTTRVAVGTIAAALLGLFAELSHSSDGNEMVPIWIIGLVLGGVWAVFLTWQALTQWQTAPLSSIQRGWHGWLQLGFVPALAAGGIVINHTSGLGTSICPILLAVVVAVMRLRRSLGASSWFSNSWPLLILIPTLRAAMKDIVSIEYVADIAAAFALLLWVVDLWKQRASLRFRW
jgi:hypothetical protein